MVVSVRTKSYQIVALNTNAVDAADRLVDHMKVNGLQFCDYVVIVGGKRLGNVAGWLKGLE